jgi:tripartite-type tricarboxylate transporter receptor subunit TctC
LVRLDEPSARLERGPEVTADNPIVPRFAPAMLAISLLMPGAAHAADFYSGKTITIIVASDAGGGYDTYTRLLARYLQKYIPGAPSIVIQDEPGGGGLRASQEIYSVVEKDGTKIGNLRSSNMLDSILNIRGGEIDPNKFEWLGNMASDTDLCSFWHTSGVTSFNDLKTKQVLIGASGTGSQGYSFPSAINSVLHTQMKIIPGYKGTGDRIIALQQGELQGNCGMNSSTVTALFPQYLADGELVPIMQSGLRPYSAFPNLPLTQSFATTDAQRRVLTSIFTQMDIARIYAAPPGTPKDRTDILRQAFMQAMNDAGLVADAKTAKLDLNPMSGEDVAKIVHDMSDLTPDLKAEARTAIGS